MSESTERQKPISRVRRIAFPLLVVALVFGGIVMVVESSTTGGVYDMTIGELQSQGDRYIGKDIRVNGVVQAGSFKENPGEKIDIEFSIGDTDGNQLKVRFHQLLPDAFQEGRQVIVQGKMLSKDEVECKRLTVKCPSKYKDENKTEADNWKKYEERKESGALPAEKESGALPNEEYPSKYE